MIINRVLGKYSKKDGLVWVDPNIYLLLLLLLLQACFQQRPIKEREQEILSAPIDKLQAGICEGEC
jgi:hypothetical protein